jgi:hypothetical protein
VLEHFGSAKPSFLAYDLDGHREFKSLDGRQDIAGRDAKLLRDILLSHQL